jgi:hypothetical protein
MFSQQCKGLRLHEAKPNWLAGGLAKVFGIAGIGEEQLRHGFGFPIPIGRVLADETLRWRLPSVGPKNLFSISNDPTAAKSLEAED